MKKYIEGMHQESSKAIVLRSIFLKENEKILTLFSERLGLVSIVMKGCSAPSKAALSEMFCEGEFFFTKGRSDLRKYQDGSILDLHLPLRNKLCFLKTASSFSKAFCTSQLPEKPAPDLYALLSAFLKQTPYFPCQETLLSCFYLKILRHEGLYDQSCKLPLISSEENQLLARLAHIQRFEELKKQTVSISLYSYVENFFYDQVKM